MRRSLRLWRQAPIDKRYEKMTRSPRKYAEKMQPEALVKGELYTPESLKAESLSMHLNRLVSLGHQDAELMERYGARAASTAAGLKPKDFALILNAFARARRTRDECVIYLVARRDE